MSKKIISIEDLKKNIQKLKDKSKKIALCHGVFDLLHIGHIKYFEEAKSKNWIISGYFFNSWKYDWRRNFCFTC